MARLRDLLINERRAREAGLDALRAASRPITGIVTEDGIVTDTGDVLPGGDGLPEGGKVEWVPEQAEWVPPMREHVQHVVTDMEAAQTQLGLDLAVVQTVAVNAALKADEAVTGTVVEYAQGASSTVAPESGWSTVAPTHVAGQYLWMRTVVTYGDESTSTSSPVLVTGNTGAPGAPGDPGAPGAPGSPGPAGVSITEVRPFWQRVTTGAAAPAQPTTATPPSPWTSIEPGFLIGTELYRVERIWYSNGTWSYTTVVRVASYDAATVVLGDAKDYADGKPMPLHGTIVPTVANTPAGVGSVYFRHSGTVAGPVIGQYTRTSSGWSETPIEKEAIASVDIGTLTAGAATMIQATAQRIAAEIADFILVRTKNLVVGHHDNLVPNGMGETGDNTAFAAWTWTTASRPSGAAGAFQSTSSGTKATDEAFMVEPGAEYLLSVWVNAASSSSMTFDIKQRNSSGTLLADPTLTPTGATTPAGDGWTGTLTSTWVERQWTFTTAATASMATIAVAHASGTQRISRVQVIKKVGPVAIIDGGVLARHLDIDTGEPGTGGWRINPIEGIVAYNADGQIMLQQTTDGDLTMGGHFRRVAGTSAIDVGDVSGTLTGAGPGVRIGDQSSMSGGALMYRNTGVPRGLHFQYSEADALGQIQLGINGLNVNWRPLSTMHQFSVDADKINFNSRMVADTDTGWRTITSFSNSWSAASETPQARYRDGVLWFRGAIQKSAGNSGYENAFTLPTTILTAMLSSVQHVSATAGSGGVSAKLMMTANSRVVQCFCPGSGYQSVPLAPLSTFTGA